MNLVSHTGNKGITINLNALNFDGRKIFLPNFRNSDSSSSKHRASMLNAHLITLSVENFAAN